MVYTYTPAYYSSFQDSITSICKSILPFSFKKRGLPAAAERKLSKQQTDNLKWQQESFHQILNLMGLHKEGILPESEVCHFKSQLLETLIDSKGTEYEQPVILRDKLLFLQELLYAKCISDEEYHASKRPLLQRLAVQGAEIEASDVIPGSAQKGSSSDEEWSVIDLKDEHCLINKDGSANSKNRFKSGSSAIKHIKGAATVLGFGGSSQGQGKNRAEKSIFDHLGSNGTPILNPVGPKDDQTEQLGQNPSDSRLVLMSEGPGLEPGNKVKKKGFMGFFNKEERDEVNGDECSRIEEGGKKSGKKQWGFDGFKKSNRRDSEDETAPLPLNERSDYDETCLKTSNLVARPIGEGPDTRQIKKKLHSDGSASDFFIDKVLGDDIKKELTRIQAELSSTNTNIQFSNDEMETISNKLPVDKADLQKFFPKSWCDRHGEVLLDVVKKEFKGHVREMESSRHTTTRERKNSNHRSRWATFDDYDDNENSHPNLFSNTTKQQHPGSTNPFLHEDDDNENKLQTQSFSNPFWNPSSFGSSTMH